MKNTTTKSVFKLSMLALAANGLLLPGVAQSKENKNTFYGDFLLRYESAEQNNPLEDADALTLRTRLGFKTKTVEGFSALIEVENVVELIDDFSVPPTGDRVGQFSVVADPEHTEIDQAFISYKTEKVSAKVGRQVITHDGHRFIGHVGWRQDRQTFDAVTVDFTPASGFNLNLSYIDKRNRIFADDADIDSEDILINTSYKLGSGKLVAYGYLLEVDNNTDNSLDTYGISYKGKVKSEELTYHYAVEFAQQETNDRFDTDYVFLEGGATFNGLTAKLGYEVLGSDDGNVGFATPLATLHKFNGWADVFLGTPAQGLEDLYLSLSGKAFGGKWSVAYHDFSSDESLAGQSDLGDEIDLVYTKKFSDSLSGGIKFADYNAGDSGFGRVDTRRTWIWAGYKF